MKKLNRKSFAQLLKEANEIEKLNLLLQLFDSLTRNCATASDFTGLRRFVQRYIRCRLKHPPHPAGVVM